MSEILIYFLVDSTAFDRQLMSSILGPAITLASRGSCGGGVAPERPLESPNRITQLIAYRREKLMKLAAVDCDAPANNASAAASEPSASGSASDGDNAQVKCKSKSKVKFLKRKHSKITEIRRAGIKCAVLQINSDSDSDEQPVDTTQPSTSSGVVSRRSRYVVHIEREAKHSNYSSSSSEDNDISGKRKHSKTDSDTSTKVHRRKHKKCKSNSKSDSTKNKSKRQKIDYDTKKKKSGRDWKLYLNDVSNAIKIQKDGPSVPVNKSSKVPSTPDSGITSGVSTSEKNGEQAQKDQNDAESSDHEQKLKNLEYFRKKVNVVRRSYRIRSKPLSQTISTTTDSSD